MEGNRRNEQPSSSTLPSPAAKIDRKTVEKNRRIHMNSLYDTFFRLIPPQHLNSSKDQKMAVAELLEQATSYVAQLGESVQQLRKRKAELAGGGGGRSTIAEIDDEFDSTFPVLKVLEMASTSFLQVILIERSSSDESVAVSQVVRVLEEEGTEVVGMNMVTFPNKLYHTINAQVKSTRVGVDTSRIAGRLHELIS